MVNAGTRWRRSPNAGQPRARRGWAAGTLGFALVAFSSARALASNVAVDVPTGCPDQTAFRQSVTSRLDPARGASIDDAEVDVRVKRTEAGGYVGSVRAQRPAEAGYARAFQAQTCDELVDTLALALAMFLEQGKAHVDTPRAPQMTPAPDVVPRAREGERSTTPVRRTERPWTAGVGAGVSSGDGAAVASRATLFVDLRVSRLRASLEAHLSHPTSVDTERGRVDTSLFGGLVAACYQHAWLFGCGLGEVDRRSVTGIDVDVSRTSSGLLAATGLRAGVVVPIAAGLVLRATADGLVVHTRHRVSIGDRDVYEFAPGMLRATLALGMQF